MALEAIIEAGVEDSYGFELIRETNGPLRLDLSKMIRELIADVQNEASSGVISAKFHNCLAAALVDMARAARQSCKLNTVALSGGVFCNGYLASRLIKLLKKADFRVLFNRNVPSNDGGISLGQAAIAVKTAVECF